MLETVRLYLGTLRHLRPSQVLWRIGYGLRRRLHLYSIPRVPNPPPDFDRECLRRVRTFLQLCNEQGIHVPAEIDALRNQSFRFLNQRSENGDRIPWRNPSFSKLWRYLLNGFVFGRDFAVNSVSDNFLGDRDRALNWMLGWIRENPPGNDPSWDAGPVSDRLLNWTLLIAAFGMHEPEVRASYLRQARWLDRWLEYDLRANHLLKNACALTLASLVLRDARLLAKGLSLLEAQVQEQILPDGGHFERSPMYHAQALWDALLVYAALEIKPLFFEDCLRKMTDFLQAIRHPDGEMPLFGDSVFHQAPATDSLLSLARALLPAAVSSPSRAATGQAMDASGIYVLGDRDKGDCMIVKTAPPMPPYQPGHSHADMLSFEVSLEGLRFIVDSGVHGYAESALREYCRSTRAHNTVQMDDIEQSEMWGTFRIAGRPQPGPVCFEAGDTEALLDAVCIHPSGYLHRRRIRYDQAQRSWEIHDHVESSGREQQIRSYLHFHPECRVQCLDNEIIAIRGAVGGRINLTGSGTVEAHLASSEPVIYWHCPEFGLAFPSPTVVLKSHGNILDVSYKITAFKDNKC